MNSTIQFSKRINNILTQVSTTSTTLQNVENRLSNLEQKQESSTLQYSSFGTVPARVELQLQSLQADLAKLQAAIYDTPISYQLADTVGMSGLKEVVTVKSKSLQYFWILLFMVGVGATIFFIYETAVEYTNEPTMTRAKLETSDFYEYPPIVLCTDAWFDAKKAIDLGFTIDALKYSLGYLRYNGPALNLTNYAEAQHQFYDTFHKNNFSSLANYYKAISMNMLPTYDLNAFYNNSTSTYFLVKGQRPVTKVILPMLAVCHAFSLNPSEGRLGILYKPERIRINFIDRTENLIRSSPNWFLFLATDATAVYAWPLVIKPSMGHVLKIKSQKIVAMSKPGALCASKNELKPNYTSANCIAECGNRLNMEVMTCQQFWISSGNDIKQMPTDYCNVFDPQSVNVSVQMQEIYQNEVLSRLRSTAKGSCFDQCPRRCDRVLYEAVLEGDDTEFDEIFGATEMEAAKNLNMSVTTIGICHGSLQQGGTVTFIEVSSYSFIELVNNIGGTLGLFVGGTLMTLPQLILFFVNYFCEKRQKTTNLHKVTI